MGISKESVMDISADISCKECQIAANRETRGTYNFACCDCLSRYADDMVERISGDKVEIVRNKLFERLLKRMGK
jgi:hypothetical protein